MTNRTTARETVVGVFSNRDDAQMAIEQLKANGFRPEDIGILIKNADEARDLADDTGTEAGEGAATGAVTGGLLGGLAGLLVGIGALAIPGIGPVLAAGPLAAALGTAAGATVTGAALGAGTGALAGALIGLGIPDDEAAIYEERFNQGRILVTVKAGANRYDKAWQILRNAGAEEIDFAGATTGTAARTTGQNYTGQATAARTATATGGETLRVPVVEETLTANKQAQQAGEVTVRKNVVEEQVNLPVEVRHEEVTVTRRAVDRPIQPGEDVLEEGEVIRVPLSQETVDVQKQARVTGEVEINKQVVAERHNVSDTVRREVVDVDTEGEVEARNQQGFNQQGTNSDYNQ